MPNTKSRVCLTNVVYRLRSLFQRLEAPGAEGPGREWNRTENRGWGSRSIPSGTPPLRVSQNRFFAPNCLPPAVCDAAVAFIDSVGRRSYGAITASFCLAIFCAMSLLPALMAEEIPRTGVGVPPVPTGRIPTRHAPVEPRPITQSAGFAFVGTVKAVEHVAAAGNNRIATTRITFHVDTAIRGVKAGQTLVITEWAGLWSSGERYRPGERVCLFLYPPSKLGLTSPVRGPAGRFRIRGPGRIVVPPGQRPILPPTVRTRLDGNGEIAAEDFARVLRERSQP